MTRQTRPEAIAIAEPDLRAGDCSRNSTMPLAEHGRPGRADTERWAGSLARRANRIAARWTGQLGESRR
eukprot:6604462-Alexandrium_andersonii.AAC.1